MSTELNQTVTIDKVVTTDHRGIDYDKLIRDFGSSKISEDHIKRIEFLTKKPAHYFLKRGIFFSQRFFY
ncbi:hypothetical protein HZS_6135 [Henneguya salminicola]|nr:hypothetical protein HZS_6135 [Henneguya salminicola]